MCWFRLNSEAESGMGSPEFRLIEMTLTLKVTVYLHY